MTPGPRTYRPVLLPTHRTLLLGALLAAILFTIHRGFEGYRLGQQLGAAVSYGNAEQVRVLLRAGAHPDSIGPDDLPVLCRAAGATSEPNEAIVRVLLEAGADPNIREPDGLRTPLMFAATTANPRLASLLIAAGAEVNAVGLNNDRALDYAVDYRQSHVAELLVRSGAVRRGSVCQETLESTRNDSG